MKNKKPYTTKKANSFLRYSSLGFEMMAIIGGFTFLGFKIDQWMHNEFKGFTLGLMIFSVVVAIVYGVRNLLKKEIKPYSMKSFIVKLTGITLGVALIGWLVFTLFFAEHYLPVLPFLLLFFYVTTIGIHAYQLNLAKKDMGRFTRSNMLVTFFKLIIYSVVAVAYIAFSNENVIPFVICLMLLYLIFTFVEVRELTKISRSK